MATQRRILDLVARIHGAGGDPAQWPAVLDDLSRLLRSHVAALFAHDLRSRSGAIEQSVGFDPDMQRAYREYYGARNVWMEKGRPLLVPGTVRLSAAMCREEDLLRTEFYADYLRKIDAFHGLGATVLTDEVLASNLTILRPRRTGAFDRREVGILETLVPHFKTALQLHYRLARLETARDAAHAALDRLPNGVLMADGAGRLIHANRAARRLLDAGDGLAYRGGKLGASTPSESASLGDAIRQAAGDAATPRLARTVRISRPDGQASLSVMVAPVERALADPGGAVLLLVSDPDTRVRPALDVLRATHGLTRAEAEVASLIAEGSSIREASARLGITLNTGRTHLKRVLSKTGTRRQADLVRLLAQLPTS